LLSGAAGGGIGTSATRMLAEVGATVNRRQPLAGENQQNLAPLMEKGLPVVPVVADISTDEGIAATMEQAGGRKALFTVSSM